MTVQKRQAGILFHPTSLPGPYGIGDLGKECFKFIDWAAKSGFSIWQVLPLGPTGFGDSPYQCFSAFAGNPYLISPDELLKLGLLKKADLKAPRFPKTSVDFGPVIQWKIQLLEKAFQTYKNGKFPEITKGIRSFKRSGQRPSWLMDYALFMALKEEHGGQAWTSWDSKYRNCDEKMKAAARKQFAERVDFQIFTQYLFFSQWAKVKDYAAKKNISIMGDIPIYVAFDSADTWANQHLFDLKKNGEPRNVAGVPPDYFSETGQLWGNPLYLWKKMKTNGYAWWENRFKAILELVDIIRLDHFRGFEAFWQVPASEETAVNGKWVKGPGADLFSVMDKKLGSLPIVAENLGVITEQVEAIRHQFNLPGMKILQFGFSCKKKPLRPDSDNVFVPHLIDENQIVYTGTHDNPTTLQWWEEFATDDEKEYLKTYLAVDGSNVVQDLIRVGMQSLGHTVIIPLQDFLNIGAEGRMNYPGRASGNWSWRVSAQSLTANRSKDIREMLAVYDRL